MSASEALRRAQKLVATFGLPTKAELLGWIVAELEDADREGYERARAEMRARLGDEAFARMENQ